MSDELESPRTPSRAAVVPVAARSGREGSTLGAELESTSSKKQCQAPGEISCPLYTDSLWEPACGNKLALLVGVILQESFH